MIDHLGRWWCRQTVLYPHAGVAITRTAVWRWSWKRVRSMRPDEHCRCGVRRASGMRCHSCPLARTR